MLRAVGFEDGDFQKPIVGIANGYSTITPCNLSLGDLTNVAVKEGRRIGMMPQVFGTITISDGISMGTPGMKYTPLQAARPVPERCLLRMAHWQHADVGGPAWRVRASPS
jgi:dihydroxyacid dehydratase/phosphogluconate dehydratase